MQLKDCSVRSGLSQVDQLCAYTSRARESQQQLAVFQHCLIEARYWCKFVLLLVHRVIFRKLECALTTWPRADKGMRPPFYRWANQLAEQLFLRTNEWEPSHTRVKKGTAWASFDAEFADSIRYAPSRGCQNLLPSLAAKIAATRRKMCHFTSEYEGRGLAVLMLCCFMMWLGLTPRPIYLVMLVEGLNARFWAVTCSPELLGMRRFIKSAT